MSTQARALSENERRRLYYETRSLCPECDALVPGRIVARDGRVYVTRTCPEHGAFEGLVSSDVAWYERLPLFDVEGIRPKNPRMASVKGCPEDCGLCTKHAQIGGAIALEISNKCNAKCPACLADNQETFELGVDDVVRVLDSALQSQDHFDSFTLTGGEPTIHPKLFEIIDALQRPEVCRVTINSNGIRIADDDAFLDRLAKYGNVNVCLHHDGPGAMKLRGTSEEVQERALERLCKWGIEVVPLVLAAKGINDRELGATVENLLLRSPFIKSVHISLMAYAGPRGSKFPGNSMDRLTIPEALDRMQEGTNGRLRKRDFIPMPMPNPVCTAVGFYLALDNKLTALAPLHDLERVIELLKNTHIGAVNPRFEQFMREIMTRVYSQPDAYDDAPALLARLKKMVSLIFPEDGSTSLQQRQKVAEHLVKSVLMLQFMDAWTFDSERLKRCSCQHGLPDGRIISSCSYYCYHRKLDPRFLGAAQPS